MITAKTLTQFALALLLAEDKIQEFAPYCRSYVEDFGERDKRASIDVLQLKIEFRNDHDACRRLYNAILALNKEIYADSTANKELGRALENGKNSA